MAYGVFPQRMTFCGALTGLLKPLERLGAGGGILSERCKDFRRDMGCLSQAWCNSFRDSGV